MTCSATTRTALTRTGALAVVFGTASVLALGPAGLAIAQEDGLRTVHAQVGGDGAVDEVEVVGSEEEAGELPVVLGISQSQDGDASTHTYEVENITVQRQTLNYTGADGQPATVEQDVALPLVGQLSVMLPASRTGVSAPGARITQLADGSTELVWSLVLFGPIGSPTQDVSFTSSGDGEPVARLDVAAVQPNATQGLSATAQAANATVNGNGILSTVAAGANDGLTKLSAGVGELIAGLEKLAAGAQELNTGIVAATDGAVKLADGSEKAAAGSGELAGGLGELKAGTGKLSAGAGALDAGAGKIVAGLDSANAGGAQLATGSTALADGATKASAGATALSEGLALISGGLGQLSDVQGLPAALDGAQQLQVGVDQLRAGLGDAATEGTILNGVAKLSGGLTQVGGGLGALTVGLTEAEAGVEASRNNLSSNISDPAALPALVAGSRGIADGLAELCAATALFPAEVYAQGVVKPACGFTSPTEPGLVIGSDAVADGVEGVLSSSKSSLSGLQQLEAGLEDALAGLGQLSAGVTALQTGTGQLDAGLLQVAGGLESGDPAKPGVAEGLDALVNGLASAVGGVALLADGADSAATGSVALAEGNAALAAGASQISAGNTSLSSGLSQLYTGSQELQAGTGALSTGAQQLDAGAGKAATGAGELNAGLGQIADGQRQVADGLPAAADGSGQIADGLTAVLDGERSVGKGLGDVKAQAVDVLASQFEQGTELARQQLAGLDAASARISSDEGAATTTWILTQARGELNAELASSDSNMARNAAIGVGGAFLLMTGIAGGYLSGRRKVIA